AAAEIVNALLVAVGSAPLDAVSCLLPTRATFSALNEAMPLALLATAPPPESAPVPTSASATGLPATGFVNASRTSTCTAGATLAPASALAGCTANDSVAGARGS